MDVTANLFIVGFIIVIGLISQYAFKKIRFPDALTLMLFGSFLAYLGIGQDIRNSPEMSFVIVLSLIYVVFYGALPIRLRSVFSTMNYSALSSLLNFIIIISLLGPLAYLFGFSWVQALSLAALFCVLDGSYINSLLEVIKTGRDFEAQIQTESALIDILVIVGVLTILNFSSTQGFDVLQNLTNYLFLSLGIGVVAAMIWAFALRFVGHISSAPIATIAILVMVYAFAEYVNANGVLTIFAFAIILGNVRVWERILRKSQQDQVAELSIGTKGFFRDISFLIRTFLFVYMGVMVDFTRWHYLLLGLLFFIIAYIVRAFIVRWLAGNIPDRRGRLFLEVMNAKGLTPIVLLAIVQGNTSFGNIVIGGVFSSMLISSIFVSLVEHNKFTSITDVLWKKK